MSTTKGNLENSTYMWKLNGTQQPMHRRRNHKRNQKLRNYAVLNEKYNKENL